jgi:hypothetical protein
MRRTVVILERALALVTAPSAAGPVLAFRTTAG